MAAAITATVASPLAQADASMLIAKTYSAHVKCTRVHIKDNNGAGFVDGYGRAKTKPAAVTAAKKDAKTK
ncbi:hypothetical protein [Sinosporangium album]|uniref:hypothetical protein n=1 Tax=Sinosporangium album TaxID=504805 RepID=UPI001C40B997|nr:hypothetical protein [Sinosporangium album]